MPFCTLLSACLHLCSFCSVLGKGVDHIFFKVEILSNEDREWHESFSLVLGPDDPVEAVLGDMTTTTVTILDQEAAGSLILPAPPIVSGLLQRIAGFVSQWSVAENCGEDRSSVCFFAFDTVPRGSLCPLHLPPTHPPTHREWQTMSGDISVGTSLAQGPMTI